MNEIGKKYSSIVVDEDPNLDSIREPIIGSIKIINSIILDNGTSEEIVTSFNIDTSMSNYYNNSTGMFGAYLNYPDSESVRQVEMIPGVNGLNIFEFHSDIRNMCSHRHMETVICTTMFDKQNTLLFTPKELEHCYVIDEVIELDIYDTDNWTNPYTKQSPLRFYSKPLVLCRDDKNKPKDNLAYSGWGELDLSVDTKVPLELPSEAYGVIDLKKFAGCPMLIRKSKTNLEFVFTDIDTSAVESILTLLELWKDIRK